MADPRTKVYLFRSGLFGEKLVERYLSLSNASLCFHKRPEDALGTEFIPCDRINTAEPIGQEKKGKYLLKIFLTIGEPLVIGFDQETTLKQWMKLLKKSKFKSELQQWLLEPSSIKLETEFAHGAFGRVWKARMSDITVAVKEMNANINVDEVELEIKILAKIRNPYCVRLLGVYFQGEKIYIVTEFMDCGDLGHVLHTPLTKLPELIKLKIMRDIGRGLGCLHDNNILHRDLKADNCLIRSFDPNATQFAVLADFGLSKIVTNMGTGGDLSTGVGTPVYMAPECFTKNYTSKIDIYSFGVLLNEIFSEAKPWSNIKSTYNSEIHTRVSMGERPEIKFESLYYDKIVSIIQACWNSNPNSRPNIKTVVQQIDSLIKTIESMNSFSTIPASNLYSSVASPHFANQASVPVYQNAIPPGYQTLSPIMGHNANTSNVPASNFPNCPYQSPSIQTNLPVTVVPIDPAMSNSKAFLKNSHPEIGFDLYARTIQQQPHTSPTLPAYKPDQNQDVDISKRFLNDSTLTSNQIPQRANLQLPTDTAFTQPQLPQPIAIPTIVLAPSIASPSKSPGPTFQVKPLVSPSTTTTSTANPIPVFYPKIADVSNRVLLDPSHHVKNQIYETSLKPSAPDAKSQFPSNSPALHVNIIPVIPVTQPSVSPRSPRPPRSSSKDVIDLLNSFIIKNDNATSHDIVGFLSKFTPEKEAKCFVDHFLTIFESGAQKVSTDSLNQLSDYFYPVISETTNSPGWKISKLNMLFSAPFFKGFLDGFLAGQMLKARGRPGEYYLRFSSEPRKLALTREYFCASLSSLPFLTFVTGIDNDKVVHHFKLNLNGNGTVSSDPEPHTYDSIFQWLDAHRMPF